VIASVAGWLLTYLVHSTLLLGGAWLMTRRRVDARWTEPLWRGALLSSLVSATVQAAAITSVATDAIPSASAKGIVAATTIVSTTSVRVALITFVVVWLVVAAAQLGRIALAYAALRRQLRRRRPAQQSIVVARAVVRSGGRLRVSLSSGLQTPIVVGRDEIVLPARAIVELSDAECRAVLAHEAAHVARHDTLWLWLTSILERALWIQPLNRLAAVRLRVLAECDCDDRAVRETGSPEALASALARVASWLSSSSAMPALGMASSESLAVRRVRRILSASRRAPAESPRGLALAVSMTTILLLAFVVPSIRVQDASAAPAVLSGTAYTISAIDDGGPFTVTLDRGRVVAVTMNDGAVSPERVEQRGNHVHVLGDTPSQSLDLTLTPAGGIRWSSRSSPSLP
jgi:beta-lactamase regulating signal transducer with metallopeptidase domain